MSYSRWSNSTLYTFWSSSLPTSKQDEQFACMVDLDHQFQWPYESVCRFVESRPTLEEVIQHAKLTEEEITELLGYMRRFIADVDSEYVSRAVPAINI